MVRAGTCRRFVVADDVLMPPRHDVIPSSRRNYCRNSIAGRADNLFVRMGNGFGDTPMNKSAFKDSPPLTDRVNAYDEAHLATYLRLLDAADEGADWREVVKIVFGLDAEADPERAKQMHDSHLARARWMTEHGYRHLLQSRMQ